MTVVPRGPDQSSLPAPPINLHGTALALSDGQAALLRGPSGVGKSDLCLRCLALPALFGEPAPLGLVADDQVLVERSNEGLILRAPTQLHGLIEVRGLGILRLPARKSAILRLVIDLIAPDAIERMPSLTQTIDILGVCVPKMQLSAFEASSALKVYLALLATCRTGLLHGV